MSTTTLKEAAPTQDTTSRVSSRKPPRRSSMRHTRRTPAPSLTHFLALPLVTPHSRPQLQSSLDAFRRAAKTDASLQIPEPVAVHAIRPLDTLHLTICVLNLPEREPELLQNAIECLNGLDLEGLWREAQSKAKEEKERVVQEEAQLGALASISNGQSPETEELNEILKAEEMEKEKRKVTDEQDEQEQSRSDQVTSLSQREPTPEYDHSDTEIIMEREREIIMQRGTKITLEREMDIIMETETEIEEQTQPEPSPELQPVRVTLKGLTPMRNPERTSVLYAPPLDPTGALQRFCTSIRDAFLPFMPSTRPPPSPSAPSTPPSNSRPSTPPPSSNQNSNTLSTNSTPSTPPSPSNHPPTPTPTKPPKRPRHRRPKAPQPVLLHATLLNTVYLPNRSRADRRVEIDARPALARFSDTVWMRDVRVEKLVLMRMGAREAVDADGRGTGVVRYVVEAERGLP